MKRPALILSGAVIGLVGVLGYHAATPALPEFVAPPSTSTGSSTTAPPATTTTTAAPPPQNSTPTTVPARNSTTTQSPPPTTPPTTTTFAPATTTTAPNAMRSATGESVNYVYGVLSVEVSTSGSKISKVKIGSIYDGGNYRSESIDQMAIPRLEQEALSVQSANIQGVSGASYTSAGFRQSLQSALSRLGL